MDRALKERVVGAIVLVVIAVLVVPVFLDGPTPDAEMVSEAVTLPGQNGAEDRRTVVLQLDRDQPLPVSSSQPAPRAADKREPEPSPPTGSATAPSGSATPPAGSATAPAGSANAPAATATTEAERKPEPEPEAEPRPEPDPPPARAEDPPPATAPAPDPGESATGMWAVQIGSFSNKENADRLAAGLREKGYAAFLSQVQTGAGSLHRVRIGPQKDRESAEAVAAKLKAGNVDGQVVPHP
jgi:DedD protein